MRNTFLALIIVCLAIVSCKKDQSSSVVKPITTNVNAKKYKVTFNVSDFSQSVGNISLNKATRLMSTKTLAAVADTSALSKAITNYYYIVYDSARHEINRIHRFAKNPQQVVKYKNDGKTYPGYKFPGEQNVSTNDPFGIITDSLSKGTYTIVVVGGTDSISVNTTFEGSTVAPQFFPLAPSPEPYLPNNAAVVYEGLTPDNRLPLSQDLFFAKTTVTVSNQGVNQAITLNRIVGQLEVNIEDAIPSNVAYFKIAKSLDYLGYNFDTETPYRTYALEEDSFGVEIDPYQTNIGGSDVGKQNFKIDRYALNTISPMTVTIRAYDSNNKVVAERRVFGVQLAKNKRTILSGQLFNNATEQFTITANQAWDGDGPTFHY